VSAPGAKAITKSTLPVQMARLINSVGIKRSALSDNNCFKYLKRIAKAVGLYDHRGRNILANHYEKIKFVSEKNSMLATFLTGKLQDTTQTINNTAAVYPFGFNISQKAAVDNANRRATGDRKNANHFKYYCERSDAR
jgi:hypothetical protein